MDLLNEIFDLFKFTDEQKQKAFSDLDTLIMSRVASVLFAEVDSGSSLEIQAIPDRDSPEGQQKIAAVLSRNFSKDRIKEEEQKAIGQTMLLYLDFMLADATDEDKEKAKAILIKYGVKI